MIVICLKELQNGTRYCDTVAFINNGVIKAVESINDGDIKRDKDIIVIITSDLEKCEEVLKNLSFVHESHRDESSLVVELDENSTPELIFSLADNKIRVSEIYRKNKGLEERYMELVEGGMRA